MPDLSTFLKRFDYRKGPLLEGWADISEDEPPRGDCGRFAWTVAKLYFGGTVPALKAVLQGRATLYRVKSPVNGFWPRHVALRARIIEDQTPVFRWIDSSAPRKWRPDIGENKKAWRITVPFILIYLAWGSLPGKLLVGAAGIWAFLNAWRLWV